MTTASKSASAEVAKLEAEHEAAHAAVREIRRKIDGYNAETEALRAQYGARAKSHPEEFEGGDQRVKPKTEAAKLKVTIVERQASNPHQAEYDEALAEFHRLDEALNELKLGTLRARIEEAQEQARAGIELAQEGAAQQTAGFDRYRAALAEVREIVTTAPGFNGKDYGWEPRIEQWAKTASEIRDTDIALPGLSPMGDWKADQHGA